jgi:glucan biosynthesis protein C
LPNTQIQPRFHALDNLRAAMMLLGVVLHSALAYAFYTLGVISAYHDADDSYLLSGITFIIHMFRMPAFFLVAGFFAAMLFQKLGSADMLRNRTKRVLLPLCVGWVVLFPLTILGAAFTVLGGPKGVSTVIQQLQSGAVLAKNDMTFMDLLTQLGLFHLWFLYYLMVYYVIMAILVAFIGKLPQRLRQVAEQTFFALVSNPAGWVLFAFITFLTMYNMPPATTAKAGFENSTALLPYFRVLAAYLVFFIFGWMLFRQQELLKTFRARAWLNFLSGLCLSGLYAFFVIYPPVQHTHLIQIAIASVAIWPLVLGVTGIFLRYTEKHSHSARYLADASYWVYLIHLPLTLFLPGFFIGLAIPGMIKFLMVFTLTTAISLITYHYFVRSTIIGATLNGRRFPRLSLKRIINP